MSKSRTWGERARSSGAKHLRQWLLRQMKQSIPRNLLGGDHNNDGADLQLWPDPGFRGNYFSARITGASSWRTTASIPTPVTVADDDSSTPEITCKLPGASIFQKVAKLVIRRELARFAFHRPSAVRFDV